MSNILENSRKTILFMLAAAFGCFVAALLAEPLFVPPPMRYMPPPAPGTRFCLTFDDSGSMVGQKRNAVKQAARDFVNKRNLEKEKVGIVVFSDSSRIHLPFSRDKSQILSAIDSYYSGGGTRFSEALEDSMRIFQHDSELQSILKIALFFTDGQNMDQHEALQRTRQLREQGIMLYAISTNDADQHYLGQMTGDSSKVFMTNDQNIADAFKQVEKEIARIAPSKGGLLEGRQKDDDREEISTGRRTMQAVVWSILLCLGMSICIVAVQNRIMRRSILMMEQVCVLIVCAILGGMIAGYVGNAVFQIIGLEIAGRGIGWGFLGASLALGMSFFIANLDRKKALIGGFLGGVLGSFGFILFLSVGDTSGRLIGAVILGACIGLMIGLVEQVYRNVWLAVLYDPRDFAHVNLGDHPVTVGSGKNDTIFINGVNPKAGQFQIDGDSVRYTDVYGTHMLKPGNRIRIGDVQLVICSREVPFSPSRFYPMEISKARELQQSEKKDADVRF